jgi:hypothetical protein
MHLTGCVVSSQLSLHPILRASTPPPSFLRAQATQPVIATSDVLHLASRPKNPFSAPPGGAPALFRSDSRPSLEGSARVAAPLGNHCHKPLVCVAHIAHYPKFTSDQTSGLHLPASLLPLAGPHKRHSHKSAHRSTPGPPHTAHIDSCGLPQRQHHPYLVCKRQCAAHTHLDYTWHTKGRTIHQHRGANHVAIRTSIGMPIVSQQEQGGVMRPPLRTQAGKASCLLLTQPNPHPCLPTTFGSLPTNITACLPTTLASLPARALNDDTPAPLQCLVSAHIAQIHSAAPAIHILPSQPTTHQWDKAPTKHSLIPVSFLIVHSIY